MLSVIRRIVLIVFNPANGPLCILPWLRRIPFAINVDGLEWRRGKWPAIGRAYFYFASWLCTLIAPEIIADARAMQKFYRDHWRRETYFAAYGAYLIEAKREGLIAEYRLEPNEYFLVVARMEPENNTDLIVEGFNRVKTDKKLAVVGGTPYKSKYYDDLVKNNKDERIHFLGPIYDQDRLNELLCNCFAYIHGHMVGGTNPVLLQALGAGSCVLYLDHDYHFNREVVADAGLGFTRDLESLKMCIETLLANPESARYSRTCP